MKKLIHFINNKPWLCLWLAIGLYFLVFSGICIWKYFQFGYNGLDLAIYNQVLFNSAHGRLFEFTFHQQSYLGDHLELLLIALVPVYYFFQHPVTLLVLQTLILALAAWPLYLIAKTKLQGLWPLLIVLLWLANPFVQNINLFEFHFLPFAIFTLLWTFYFYQHNRFRPFLLMAFISLLIREDVSLVVFMFGPLALIDKKSLKWIIWPMLLAGAWFWLAVKIIAHFSSESAFKFLIYYGWLGENFSQMIVNFFTKPWLALPHLARPGNLLIQLMLFLPLGFLSVLRPKYLLLALPIYLQMSLMGASNSNMILKMHYASLFLPALFIALIYSLSYLKNDKIKSRLGVYLKHRFGPVKLLLGVSAFYGLITLGPIPGVIYKLFNPAYPPEVRQIKRELVESLDNRLPTAASYELLTNLSGRVKIYSLHYAFIGKAQLSELDYRLPEDVQALVIDFGDLLEYQIQFPNNKLWKKYYWQGDDNLRKIIAERGFTATRVIDSLVLFEKKSQPAFELYQILTRVNAITNRRDLKLGETITFLGWTPLPEQDLASQFDLTGKTPSIFPVALYFQAQQKIEKNYQFKVILKNNQGQIVHSKIYPLAYGLYPTSEWQAGQIMQSNYRFLLPAKLKPGEYQVDLQMLDYQGFFTLDGLRSAVMRITKEENLGPLIDLGVVTIN